MSKMSIDQLRSAYKKPENNSQPNNYLTFWDMKVGEQTEVRFLPDKDDTNPMGFMIEKKSHSLNINGQKKTVACLSQYGEKCPICDVSREYYKVEGKGSVNGKKYYRNVQYLTQALVINTPVQPKDGEESPVGKVKLLSFGYSIYKIIKDAFESGDLEAVPFDFQEGTNFVIKKDQQGEYASYSLSKFARRETALDDDTIAMCQEQMVELSSLLPKNPGLEKVESMLEADLTGGTFAEEGSNIPAAKTPAPAPVGESAPTPTPTPAKAGSATDGELTEDEEAELLVAQIRARRAQKAE